MVALFCTFIWIGVGRKAIVRAKDKIRRETTSQVDRILLKKVSQSTSNMKLFSFGAASSSLLLVTIGVLSLSRTDPALFATGDMESNQQPRFLRTPAGSPQTAADRQQVVPHVSAPGASNPYRLSRRLFDDEEEPSRKQRQGDDPGDDDDDDDDGDDDDDDGVSLLRSNLLCSLLMK